MKNSDLFRLSAMKDKIDKDNIKGKVINSSFSSDEIVLFNDYMKTPIYKKPVFRGIAIAACLVLVLTITLVLTLVIGNGEEVIELYIRSSENAENYEQYNFAYTPAVINGKDFYPTSYGIASFADVNYSECKFLGDFQTNEGIQGKYFEIENGDGTYTLNFEFNDDYTLYQSYVVEKEELESKLSALVESAKSVRLVSQDESKAPVYAVAELETAFSLLNPDKITVSNFAMRMPTEDGAVIMIANLALSDNDDSSVIGEVVKTSKHKDNFLIENYSYATENGTFTFEFAFDISVSGDVLRDEAIIKSIKTLRMIDSFVAEPIAIDENTFYVSDESFEFEAQNGTTIKTDGGIDFYGITANFSICLPKTDSDINPMANPDAKDENGILHFVSWGLYDAIDSIAYEKQGEFETADGIKVIWHDVPMDNDVAARFIERRFNVMYDFGVLTFRYHIANDFANEIHLLDAMIESASTVKLVSKTENTLVEGIDDVSKIPADTDSIEHLMTYYEAKGIISGENEIDEFMEAMKRGEERELTVIYWTFTRRDDERYPNGYLFASSYYELKCKDGIGYYRSRQPIYLMGKTFLGYSDGEFTEFNGINKVYVHTESMYYDEMTGKRQSYIYLQYWLDVGDREYYAPIMSHYVATGSEIDKYDNVEPCVVMNSENAPMIMRWPLSYFTSRDADDFAEDICVINPPYNSEFLKGALEGFEELDVNGKFSSEIEKFRNEYEQFIKNN